MKKFFKNLKNKMNSAVVSAKTAIIGVVIGGVILAGLYTLFNSTVLPTLTTKIGEMFNYSGT